MYESFYGLRAKPFDLDPDPDYIYMSGSHQEAYVHLRYGIEENKGLVVVTGEIGSGKTTLINFLLSKLHQSVCVGVVNNTTVAPRDFISMVCEGFGLNLSERDKPRMLAAFNQYLRERRAANDRVVLIVDEAQNLPRETIEELRLLSNMEGARHHLLQVILLGQPELKDKLREKGLEQFVQRITIHFHLGSLTQEEVMKYVRHRLRIAGAKNHEIFDEGALRAVHGYTRGTPRLINILCDNALVYGFGEQRRVIAQSQIDEIVSERKAGGLCFAAEEDREGAPTSASPGLSEHVEGRLQDLERRLQEDFGRRLKDLERGLKDLERGLKDHERIADFHQKYLVGSRRAHLRLCEAFRALKQQATAQRRVILEESSAAEPSEQGENGTTQEPVFRVYGRGRTTKP
jgi:general secretion pathway protein A